MRVVAKHVLMSVWLSVTQVSVQKTAKLIVLRCHLGGADSCGLSNHVSWGTYGCQLANTVEWSVHSGNVGCHCHHCRNMSKFFYPQHIICNSHEQRPRLTSNVLLHCLQVPHSFFMPFCTIDKFMSLKINKTWLRALPVIQPAYQWHQSIYKVQFPTSIL